MECHVNPLFWLDYYTPAKQLSNLYWNPHTRTKDFDTAYPLTHILCCLKKKWCSCSHLGIRGGRRRRWRTGRLREVIITCLVDRNQATPAGSPRQAALSWVTGTVGCAERGVQQNHDERSQFQTKICYMYVKNKFTLSGRLATLCWNSVSPILMCVLCVQTTITAVQWQTWVVSG